MPIPDMPELLPGLKRYGRYEHAELLRDLDALKVDLTTQLGLLTTAIEDIQTALASLEARVVLIEEELDT
jgi:hypothetical protein